MIKRLLLLNVLLASIIGIAHAQVGTGTLIGTITDETNGEPIPFANVVVFQAGQQVTGASTDFDGKYKIAALKPANDYVVKASTVGYTAQEKRGVIVKANKNNFVDFKMSVGVKLDEVVVIDYEVPLIEKDGGSSTTVTGKDIEKMPSRGAAAAVTTAAGVQDNDGAIGSVRGTRSGSTYTYIDGVKVRGSASLPQAAYEQVQVLTGGVPAQYGDATGGIISITTRGAARKVSGSVELVSSGGIKYNDNNDYLFDAQGYHLGAVSLTGPLISVKDRTDPEGKRKRPVVGFFLAGEANWIQDPRPSAIGNYYIKDDVLADLEANPIVQNGQGASILRSELVRRGDLEWTQQRKNTRRRGVVASGNLDFYLTPSISLKVGGSVDINDRKLYSYNGSMFNFKNNGLQQQQTWRVFGRFTQRFNSQQGADGKEKKSAISNAFYSIQADYESYTVRNMNENHKDELFKYGYLGRFTTYREPTYAFGYDEEENLFGFLQGPNNDTMVVFEASDINPNLAAYTQQYYNQNPDAEGRYENLTQIEQDRGALRNGDVPRSVYGLWTNTGTQYNSYAVLNQTQFRVMATGSFDIKNHSISLGFEYEQRTDRSISYAPRGLWNIARLRQNAHLAQQDTDNPLVQYDEFGVYTDTINYNLRYTPKDSLDPLQGGVGQSFFDYNVRQALGLDPAGTELLDIDSYDPDFFDVSWFSADELLNAGNSLVSYYGYDHTGQRISGRPTFEDFFTEKDQYGRFTRRIGAFEPIYIAGYIQDEFTFKDLIFRVGVRVDRFDANQKVLKDRYLFREARTVDEAPFIGTNEHTPPSNIPGSAVVYVNSLDNPTAAVGYRDGDTWYNAQGIEVSDPSVLQTGTGIAPYLFETPGVDPLTQEPEPVTTAGAFKDYEPQINVMPRISFSFPISENALFYANYDVLTQRPLGNNRLNLIDYLFIENTTGNINNPDLRPETTIEYAVGFKQKISKRSAVELNAFYREMRDQITVVRISEAYPRTYFTFDNLDFGTVKGLTLTYDLRRTKNIQLRLAYTLQFADGTGSSSTTNSRLVNAGFPNLRVIQPLDFDQRHNIVVSADYRFGEGKNYNGPKTVTKGGKTINWLQNFGVNAIIRAGSGNPFSRQSNIQPTAINNDNGSGFLVGSINGSNRPWQFRVDMRIDKDFKLTWKKAKDGKPAKTSYLNVYVDIQNLLGNLNVLSAYRATGNPDDDGYLLAQQSQPDIESQTDPQSFRDLYSVKVNRPTNYSLPRRIRLGLLLNF